MAHQRAQTPLLAVKASSSVGIWNLSRDADLSHQDYSDIYLAADGGTCVLCNTVYSTRQVDMKTSPLLFCEEEATLSKLSK